MEATQAPLLNLLNGNRQFAIPIYQRTYSWKTEQCRQLLNDLTRFENEQSDYSHFIGSIVHFKPGNPPINIIQQHLVIDGQQRLTTISLLLLAIVHYLKQEGAPQLENATWEEIQDTYLINKHRKDDSKYKLLLTRKDKETYVKLIEEIQLDHNYSEKLYENYWFFRDQLNSDNVQTIFNGILKLIVVDVSLEKEKDNPQLIFESLNSTGLELSQADLIRNYIMMSLPLDQQEEVYNKYWFPMEQSFGERLDLLAWFIRDYLTMQKSSIPRIDEVYETYKAFVKENEKANAIIDAVKSLYTYSRYYTYIANLQEKDPVLYKRFSEIYKLKTHTSYPLIMAVYGDYENNQITRDEFAQILDIIISYVFRRVICGIPTNSLNKTFATFHRYIKQETYLESFKAQFLLMQGYRRFPTDAEFSKELKIKDVYNFRLKSYLLESLENFGKKEPINASNYTIEHILPQNENLSEEWQQELGENWKEVRDQYLHTIGNSTLTGYNPELSDHSFKAKKIMEGGFNKSPLFLNEYVRNVDTWNEQAILSRAEILAERACKIWPLPNLSADKLDLYREPEKVKEEEVYDLEHYEYLTGDVLNLFHQLEKRILSLDESVRMEYKKLYIAFKAETNFVDVIPQKKRLLLSLNTKIENIHDPKGLARDILGLGRWGNGGVEISLENQSQLDDAMDLIEQSFQEQVEIF